MGPRAMEAEIPDRGGRWWPLNPRSGRHEEGVSWPPSLWNQGRKMTHVYKEEEIFSIRRSVLRILAWRRESLLGLKSWGGRSPLDKRQRCYTIIDMVAIIRGQS